MAGPSKLASAMIVLLASTSAVPLPWIMSSISFCRRSRSSEHFLTRVLNGLSHGCDFTSPTVVAVTVGNREPVAAGGRREGVERGALSWISLHPASTLHPPSLYSRSHCPSSPSASASASAASSISSTMSPPIVSSIFLLTLQR
eukprot:1500127-Pyramimonas_sp.AAC.1